MKNTFKQMVFILTVLFLILNSTEAAVFATLHGFTAGSFSGFIWTNIDGISPSAGLLLSGNTLYGTTSRGGTGYGTVFKINTDGTQFAILHYFSNYDGANPSGGLVLGGNTLYGTTQEGGTNNNVNKYGTMFKINTDGTHFASLHSFRMNDGAYPFSTLVLSSNILYGITSQGGLGAGGTIFAINTNGTGFTTNIASLFGFPNPNHETGPEGLVLVGNTLYGINPQGGSGAGTVFAVNTDGTEFTNLYSFNSTYDLETYGALLLSSNILYGTTSGTPPKNGTIFKINTNGVGFTNFYTFTSGAYNDYGVGTNSDGGSPLAGLILSGNILYGTTAYGGYFGNGTVFAINTDGTGFINLHTFSATNYNSSINANTNSDGASSIASLVLSGNTLYGTTSTGGSGGSGTVFALSLGPIPLNIQSISNAVVLSWGNPAFSLQAAPAATGVYTNVPDAASPYTNAITSSQMFFRLEAQ